MIPPDITEAVRLARLEVGETHMLTYAEYRKVARALLAAADRLARVERVVDAARAFYSVRTGMHTNGAGHTREMRETREQMEIALAALDALATGPSGAEAGR